MSRKGDRYETGHGFGPLFSPPENHLSGRTDPQTSRDAARRMKQSGALNEAQRLALRLVTDYPGRTCPELAVFAEALHGGPYKANGDREVWRQRIGRRLPELEKAGLIRRDGVRDGCSVWWPV